MSRIKELQDFISGQETDITEFDEVLAKKLIEKITVLVVSRVMRKFICRLWPNEVSRQ